MAGEFLKLQYGEPAQVDAADYAAGTMYLAKTGSNTADLYFDMGGTRLQIEPDTLDASAIEGLVEQATAAYQSNSVNNAQVNDMIDDI